MTCLESKMGSKSAPEKVGLGQEKETQTNVFIEYSKCGCGDAASEGSSRRRAKMCARPLWKWARAGWS